ncbi:preprotein translocase subunit YajC [Bifidobacterium mongoliense]|jgi:preprotein translocase subunit YajC|uniref:Preprotein translocase subunit YajC n=1 Tax=Bifidobacterium mongoliense DSM 21395 TaxID=1437603 RepID=A0A087C0M7_9BIFI|nr:preprotein translocase subunit YajC [Bifidobacterium mongoliense]KFI76827.1 preprotein translocase subunit YajC [Bifidobacterium mongoliense DSM 21395]
MESIFLIVIVIAFGVMMWWQSRKAKQQRSEMQDFRANLAPGTMVATIGGVIGKVVSVDTKYEEIVIDSEGSLLRFKFAAVNKTYERPAFIDDDDVDENGNPVDTQDDGVADVDAPAKLSASDTSTADEAAQQPYEQTPDEAVSSTGENGSDEVPAKA